MGKKFATILFLLATFFTPFSAWAKSINLYGEPKDSAKVVGSLDSDAGIIAIYTPEKSDWIKVADPRNGNVGWIKTSDLGNANSSEYTFTQRYINTGSSPQTYQIIQMGGSKKMTPEQVQAQLKQMENQQQQMQENINRSMQNMINDMNNLYRVNSNMYNTGIPFIMPVLVVPAQTAAPANNTKTPSSDKTDKNNK